MKCNIPQSGGTASCESDATSVFKRVCDGKRRCVVLPDSHWFCASAPKASMTIVWNCVAGSPETARVDLERGGLSGQKDETITQLEAKRLEDGALASDKKAQDLNQDARDSEEVAQGREHVAQVIEREAIAQEKDLQALQKDALQVEKASKTIELESASEEDKKKAKEDLKNGLHTLSIDTEAMKKDMQAKGQEDQENELRTDEQAVVQEAASLSKETDMAQLRTDAQQLRTDAQATERDAQKVESIAQKKERDAQTMEDNAQTLERDAQAMETAAEALKKDSKKLEKDTKADVHPKTAPAGNEQEVEQEANQLEMTLGLKVAFVPCYQSSSSSGPEPGEMPVTCPTQEGCMKLDFKDGQARMDPQAPPTEQEILESTWATGGTENAMLIWNGVGIQRSDPGTWGICVPTNGAVNVAVKVFEMRKAQSGNSSDKSSEASAETANGPTTTVQTA
mmetsp:Transcript_79505/g.247543  ORF Transcript_79505/g.247543 Transcript_79505/m.247543 type:complete len:453 (+) Transcript_79505:268-1626(+)